MTAVGNRLALTLRQKNEDWALELSDTITKNSLPCVLGTPVIARRRVVAFLSVKFHRLNQVHPLGDPYRYSGLAVILREVLRLGYTPAYIARACSSIRHKAIRDLTMLCPRLIVACVSNDMVLDLP